MASLYKRGKRYWIGYTLNGERVDRSLFTDNLRVARDKKRKIEYELAIGDLEQASRLPLLAVLEAYCKYLQAHYTYKSYKNDFSRLRNFFGPVCDALKPSPGCPYRKPYPPFAQRPIRALAPRREPGTRPDGRLKALGSWRWCGARAEFSRAPELALEVCRPLRRPACSGDAVRQHAGSR